MLRYSDLTNEQKKFICNGCGGKGGWVKPPNFIFKASCNQHDFYYWRGYTEEDKKRCDKKFYELTKEDIDDANVNTIKSWYYHTWAYAYYKFVRAFGKKYFYYGTKSKTLDSLINEMNKENK